MVKKKGEEILLGYVQDKWMKIYICNWSLYIYIYEQAITKYIKIIGDKYDYIMYV